jgi:hypothetical protein
MSYEELKTRDLRFYDVRHPVAFLPLNPAFGNSISIDFGRTVFPEMLLMDLIYTVRWTAALFKCPYASLPPARFSEVCIGQCV